MPQESLVTPELLPSSDPVSAVSNAAQVLFHFLTATLPSDAQRLAAFKLRNPLIYAHIRMRIYRRILSHLRLHWHEDITTYVHLVAGGFTPEEQGYMIKLAQADLKRQ